MFGANRKAGLKPGQVLAISGTGALGHIGVQMAQAMVGDIASTDAKGLFTVAIDARPGPLDMCRTFKHAPDVVINAAETSAQETRRLLRNARSEADLDNDRPDGVDGMSRINAFN